MAKRDTIEQFVQLFADSLANGSFVSLTFSRPSAENEAADTAMGRLVGLKEGLHLSVSIKSDRQTLTKNIAAAEAAKWLAEQFPKNYRGARLETTHRAWQFFISDPGKVRIIGHKPAVTQAPPLDHDQEHPTLLGDPAKDWLTGLDILSPSGHFRGSLDKYRQIDRYLEIFSHLARDCGWTSPQSKPPAIADMGCGKGYLTFGVWHLFHRVWNLPARIIGVEARPELVATTNQLARQIHADQLEFIAGTIDSAILPAIDALIALHACNTATDDALLRGINAEAKLILLAPCCHQEIRPQMGRPIPFDGILQHGLMAERMGEWVTDGLRLLHLKWAGYHTKAIEFVDPEHTPKNLLIAAVRSSPPFTSAKARDEINDFKTFFGIRQQALDSLLERHHG